MEQNMISLMEVIQLMKEVRKNTDDFISDLKSSIYLEEEGKYINPQFIQIRFFDNSYYTLDIDGYSFRLDSNGNAIFNLLRFNKDKEFEAKKILFRNNDVITNTLKCLESNSPKYYVCFTNVKNYMTFETSVGTTCVSVDTNKVSINSPKFGKLTVNYYVNNNNITFESGMHEVSIESFSEGNKVNVEKLYMEVNNFFENAQINTEELPMVLKNQIKLNNNKKKI